jgi:hypothetical protein
MRIQTSTAGINLLPMGGIFASQKGISAPETHFLIFKNLSLIQAFECALRREK